MDQVDFSSSEQDEQKLDPNYVQLNTEADYLDACDELEKHNMDFVRSLLYQSS